MPPIQPYKAGNFGGATQVRAVDAGGLISALQAFQEEAGKRAVESAVIKASKAGQAEGEAAFQGGRAVTGGREDTAAGQAYLKAAEAQWFARTEVHAQESAQELETSWSNNDYGDDLASWEKARTEKMKALFEGANPQMAQKYAPRVESIFNRTKGRVTADYQNRVRVKARADNDQARGIAEIEALGQFRNGEAVQTKDGIWTTEGAATWASHLQAAVDARLIDATEAQKETAAFALKAEAYMDLGDFDQAADKAAFIEAYRDKGVPSGLDPKTYDWVLQEMETEKKRLDTQASDERVAQIWQSDAFQEGTTAREMMGEVDRLLTSEDPEEKITGAEATKLRARVAGEIALRDKEQAQAIREVRRKVNEEEILTEEDQRLIAETPGLQEWADRLQAHQLSGFAVVTDPFVYQQLAVMRRTNPQKFIEADLLEYRNHLDQATYNAFELSKESLTQAAGRGKMASVQSLEERAVAAAVREEILPKTPMKEWEANDLLVHSRFLTTLQSRLDAEGVKADDRAGFDRVVREMLSEKVRLPDSWWGLSKGAEVWPGMVDEDNLPSVKDGNGGEYPDDEKTKAIQWLGLQLGIVDPKEDQIRAVIEKARSMTASPAVPAQFDIPINP
jgi:hypothetical protein